MTSRNIATMCKTPQLTIPDRYRVTTKTQLQILQTSTSKGWRNYPNYTCNSLPRAPIVQALAQKIAPTRTLADPYNSTCNNCHYTSQQTPTNIRPNHRTSTDSLHTFQIRTHRKHLSVQKPRIRSLKTPTCRAKKTYLKRPHRKPIHIKLASRHTITIQTHTKTHIAINNL
jgi:hypothetical protein